MYNLKLKHFSLESSVNGLKVFGGKLFENFSANYEINFTFNDSILIFNKKNYVGIEILSCSDMSNIELHVFISGVYLPDFYNDLKLRHNGFYRGGSTNLAEVYLDLIVYESINKDDFYDLFNILSDYANHYEESSK